MATKEEITRAVARFQAELTAAAPMLGQLMSCPDTCPVCGADLAREGWPAGHQHESTGDVCAFSWDTRQNAAGELCGRANAPADADEWCGLLVDHDGGCKPVSRRELLD